MLFLNSTGKMIISYRNALGVYVAIIPTQTYNNVTYQNDTYHNTVKFCGVSSVQLPNNLGAGPGTGRGTARENFAD